MTGTEDVGPTLGRTGSHVDGSLTWVVRIRRRTRRSGPQRQKLRL